MSHEKSTTSTRTSAVARKTDATHASNGEAPAARPVSPVNANRMRLYEFTNSFWKVILPAGTTPDELTKVDLWAAIADQLHPHDEVLAVAADGAWFAKLIVADAVPQLAQMAVLAVVKVGERLEAQEPGLAPGHEIRRADVDDPQGGWVIERKADGVILGRGLPDYEAARRYLNDHASLKKDAATNYLP